MSDSQDNNGVFHVDDLNLLVKNRKLKEKLISKLVGPNEDSPNIPVENADKSMLMGLIESIDREVLSRTKIKVAAKVEESNGNIKDLAVQLLMNFKPRQASSVPDVPLEQLMQPPSDIQARAPVPGETEIGTVNLTLKDIEEN